MAACSFSLIFFFLIVFSLIVKKLFWVSSSQNLKNKHVLVGYENVLLSGGSSGIGKSVAIEASKQGANVTIVARDVGRLEAAVEEIKKVARHPEQKIRHFALDVTKGSAVVDEAVEAAEDSAGSICLLVNCVGMAVCGEFEKATESDYRYMMDLNYFGTVFPTLSVAKRMKTRKEGHIVITGSQASFLGIYGMSAFCSSKFAVRGFAESLHMELLPHGVSVTVCFPPDTDTPGFAMEEESKPKITKLIWGTAGLFRAEDVARQILSDALRKKFFSSVGLESFLLSTLCAGMSPFGSFTDAFLQISLMSLLRLMSVGYRLHFHRIIKTNSKTTAGEADLKKVG